MVSTTAAAASARIASTTISSTSVKPLRGGRALAVSTVNIRIVVGPAGGAVGAERPDVERRPVRSRRLIMIGPTPRVGGQFANIAAEAQAIGLRQRRRRVMKNGRVGYNGD